jgi:hypothetical protein
MYDLCFPVLEKMAIENNMVVTESVREDEFVTDEEEV